MNRLAASIVGDNTLRIISTTDHISRNRFGIYGAAYLSFTTIMFTREDTIIVEEQEDNSLENANMEDYKIHEMYDDKKKEDSIMEIMGLDSIKEDFLSKIFEIVLWVYCCTLSGQIVLRFTEYKDYKNNIFLNDLTSISCRIHKKGKYKISGLQNVIAYINQTFSKTYKLEY